MTEERRCSTCFYDSLGWNKQGHKKCLDIIGVCATHNNLQGWKQIEEEIVLDTDRFIPQPTVMVEPKGYMDFIMEEQS